LQLINKLAYQVQDTYNLEATILHWLVWRLEFFKTSEIYIKCCTMVGFDAKNKDIINGLYICRKCSLILREPFQLKCGHRQCRTCIETVEGELIKCAECLEETSKREIMPDRGFRNDMKLLLIICSLCSWSGLFQEYEIHLNQEHQNPICEYCKQRFSSATRLDEHKQKECTEITIPCALKEFGCHDQVYRVRLPEHYLTDIHQKAIMTAVNRMGMRMSSDANDRPTGMDIDAGQSSASSVTTTNENLSTQMQEIYETINILASSIQTLNDETQRLRFRIAES